MRIVVLGWGSLIWNPGNLEVEEEWHKDGPCLPIEFARISKDGRLTLVLFPDAEKVQVLWAYMKTDNLEEAIEGLKRREGTTKNKIGFLDRKTGQLRCNVLLQIKSIVERWAEEKNIDVVIWTDLPSNFEEERKKEFTEENVIHYLMNLPKYQKREAEKYIRKASPQVKTRMRRVIEERLGWTYESNCR